MPHDLHFANGSLLQFLSSQQRLYCRIWNIEKSRLSCSSQASVESLPPRTALTAPSPVESSPSRAAPTATGSRSRRASLASCMLLQIVRRDRVTLSSCRLPVLLR